jgi:signal transduction histidine kinase
MVDIEAHRHTYRSPIAAIIGLADAALLRDSLDADLVKHLRAIRTLAQQALDADDAEQSRLRSVGARAEPENQEQRC